MSLSSQQMNEDQPSNGKTRLCCRFLTVSRGSFEASPSAASERPTKMLELGFYSSPHGLLEPSPCFDRTVWFVSSEHDFLLLCGLLKPTKSREASGGFVERYEAIISDSFAPKLLRARLRFRILLDRVIVWRSVDSNEPLRPMLHLSRLRLLR